MSETKNGGDDVDDLAVVLLAGVVINAVVRSTCLRGEGERLLYSQRWKMDVVLRAVLDVSAVVFVDLLRREGMIMDVALDRMVFVPVISQDAQKGTAARSWASQDH